jgi:uncharacterized protein YjiS (DUF1127 family)
MALLDLFVTPRPTFAAKSRAGLATRLALWRSRRSLAALDSAALADIGVSSEHAEREARKGLWDVPDTWIDRRI